MNPVGILSILISLQTGTNLEFSPASSIADRANIGAVAAAENLAQLSVSQEAQAKQLYQMGRFTEAIELLVELDAEYTAISDENGRIRVLRNLALVYQQAGDIPKATQAITDSLEILQTSSTTIANYPEALARVLEIQGQLQLATGQAELALETWQEAAKFYESIQDIRGITISQINQAQAWQKLGQYRQAIDSLQAIKTRLESEPDTLIKATALKSLGDAWGATGNLKPAQEVLAQSLRIAQQLSDANLVASVFLSLGKNSQFQADLPAALDFYQQAESASSDPHLHIQAKLNQLRVAIALEKWSDVQTLIPDIDATLALLPRSGKAVNARINFARSLMSLNQQKLPQVKNRAIDYSQDIAQLLAAAVRQAEDFGDTRTQAYALGTLARLYEQNQQLNQARELTEQALILAQSIQAAEIVYQWQWQLGRILNSSGERNRAIAAYSEAVKTLDSLRGDLVSVSSDLQFSFTEKVEPVYRELVDILLKPGSNIEQYHLSQARETIESLQLAELDNFFRDACLDSTSVQIDRIDPTAAVIYPIILPDRLEVIAKLPDRPLVHFTIFESQATIEQTVLELRNEITNPIRRRGNAYKQFVLPIAQQFYDWTIRPIADRLESTEVETLVFVLDGAMRNLPISVLHDGNQYAIEKYAIALTPGLQMLDPRPLTSQSFKTLASGLSQARQNYPALPGVEVELQQIQERIPTEVLLNEEFTEVNFKNTVNQAATRDRSASFPVVHIATHGEFASTAENTFILTWDDRINAKELDSFLRAELTGSHPIELLVFSACRSALGDDRAALGLAGIAVRAGARSTVGSLWYVSDDATGKLMIRFYQELADSFFKSENPISKAEALRRAQVSVLQDHTFFHPYFWSAFVLVGNWF